MVSNNQYRGLQGAKPSCCCLSFGLTPARKTYPTRYKPDRACLAACLAEAAMDTYDSRVFARKQRPSSNAQSGCPCAEAGVTASQTTAQQSRFTQRELRRWRKAVAITLYIPGICMMFFGCIAIFSLHARGS